VLRSDRDCLNDAFSKKDLAVLFENALDLDGGIMALVSKVENPRDHVTAVITLLMMIKDAQLQEVAICHFIQASNLFDMLLETDGMTLLEFKINRGLSLRDFLKQDRFKSLVKKAASLFESKDYQTTVCLLDKIKEYQAVLQKLVDISFQRIADTKPLDFVSPEIKRANTASGRQPHPRVL